MARSRALFLDEQDYLGFARGSLRWRSPDRKRLYTWDDRHEHIEVYNQRGRHLGVADENGQIIGEAVKGRKIDV
jgi:hypothetical protein